MASRAASIFDPSKPCSPLSVPSAHTALLLMDYQGLAVSFLGDEGPRTVSIAYQMRDWALKKKIPIFHCLIDTASGASPAPSMKAAERWHLYEEKLRQMPQLGDEAKELAFRGDTDLEKRFTRTPGVISVLLSPGLKDSLEAKQVRSLIVCGLSTSGCVLSTVRAATDEGFIVTVVEDACADPVPGMHELLMRHALASTAHVAKVGEIWEAWEGIEGKT